ncbi:MAG: hypothetical protein GY911_12580 [Actinomycetales bacterium]|nr:hypothetical protein [Actinomycetales bacterium]
MKLLEDDVAMDEPLDGPNLERILLRASQSGETNLSLVADDGSYLAVSLSAGTDTQLISAPSSLAAPTLCTTSPLQIDRVTEVFGLFLAGDPRWRDVVDWSEGQTEAAVQAAHAHSRRAWKWIARQYVRALVVIPIIALVATGGDIRKSALVTWIAAGFGLWVKAIMKFPPYVDAARERVGTALGVTILSGQRDYSNDTHAGWVIEGEAPAWKQLAVLASLICVMIGVLLYLILVPMLVFGGGGYCINWVMDAALVHGSAS